MSRLSSTYTWSRAYPVRGDLDDKKALTGDDLVTFVDQELFPYLGRLKQSSASHNTIQYKVGEIFGEIRSKFRSGYILRDVIEQMQALSFNTQSSRHELSQLYETRIRRMGNAGRNGGESHPRPLIRAMIRSSKKDGAVGSAGFLCEAYEYMSPTTSHPQSLKPSDQDILWTRKKGLAYIIGLINMILHGIEHPTLSCRTASIKTSWISRSRRTMLFSPIHLLG